VGPTTGHRSPQSLPRYAFEGVALAVKGGGRLSASGEAHESRTPSNGQNAHKFIENKEVIVNNDS